MNPSSHFFDKFKKTNLSDWTKIAEKELNGKPLESLNYVYNEEIHRFLPTYQYLPCYYIYYYCYSKDWAKCIQTTLWLIDYSMKSII